jgi:hypothetical protein
MWSLGFRSVTLVPTFAVHEPFEIGLDYTPPFATIRAVLMHALALGMDVKIEPHIDWKSTLDTVGEWRGFMQFNPEAEYFDRVIGPMRELAIEAKAAYPERRISLTLGAELDRSVREFPDGWLDVLYRAAAPGIEIGHKLNHDAASTIFAAPYLASLDYVSYSFYPKIRFRKPREWWASPKPDKELEPLADAFERNAEDLRRKLPRGPEFQIAEFGLGSADVEHPYKLVPAFYRTMDEANQNVRRNYYRGFLHYGSRQGTPPITFWSAGYFDFLGVFSSEYQDEALVSLVQTYNTIL